MANLLNSQQVRFSVSNKLILFFIDGIGIGSDDPTINPCCFSTMGIFQLQQNLPDHGCKYALDAQMGMEGLPQSATGHTTIYTGRNAPGLINKHLTGFPNKELRDLLKSYSLFVQLKKQRYRCKFINAFRPVFFTTPEIFANLHMSATTEMNRYAGNEFSSFKDIKRRRALYHDYTNKENIRRGFDLPSFSASEAAKILISETDKYDLILYEYFMTDFAGHAQDMKRSIYEISKVEKLIKSLLKQINRKTTTLVVVSDHGNIEDLSTKSHTTNPAFLGIWDHEPPNKYFQFKSLQDLFPYIYYKIVGELYA